MAKVSTSVRLDNDFLEKFKAYCKVTGQSYAEVIESTVNERIDSEKKQDPDLATAVAAVMKFQSK